MELRGWQYIVYELIKNNFKDNSFTLFELYSFEEYFKLVYPHNYHIKDKLRQTLQKLRDNGFLTFFGQGNYRLKSKVLDSSKNQTNADDFVYLLSNASLQGWVKIGRTSDLERRMRELYNTSVPLPFNLERYLRVSSIEEGRTLEKSIHEIIDTINPELRQNTEARKREFFKLSISAGNKVFQLVSKVMSLKAQESLRTI